MIFNHAPFNAAPINAAGRARVVGGSEKVIQALPEGFARAQSGSVSVVEVLAEWGALYHSDQTTYVEIISTGGGASSNVAAGAVALVPVDFQGVGIAREYVADGSTRKIEVFDFGHWSQIFAGAVQPVLVDPFATPGAKGGSLGFAETDADGYGMPTIGNFSLLEVDATGWPLIAGGSDAEVEVSGQAGVMLLAGAEAVVEAEALLGNMVRHIGSFTTTVDVQAQAGSAMNLGATSSIEVPGWGKGTPTDGNAADVVVTADAVPLVGSGEAAIVEVEAQQGNGAAAGSESIIEVTINTGGFKLARVGAPLFRIIEVRPKRRVISFAGDDRSLRMAGEFEKQPREVVDYDIDMREWFAVNRDGDFINRVEEVIIDPPGELALGSTGTPETLLLGDPPMKAKVWVSGGEDGGEYKVTVVIRTNIGRIEEIDFTVRVEDI